MGRSVARGLGGSGFSGSRRILLGSCHLAGRLLPDGCYLCIHLLHLPGPKTSLRHSSLNKAFSIQTLSSPMDALVIHLVAADCHALF